MKAHARVLNPDNVTLELTLSLTVSEWKQIEAKLPNEWPHWQLGSVISSAIRRTVGVISTESAEIVP